MRHHRRRRAYRRNPGFASVRGFFGMIREGAVGGLYIMGGRVASRALPDLTGISSLIANSNITGFPATVFLAMAQLFAGTLTGYAFERVMGGEAGAMVVSGAFDGVYEDLLSSLSIPVIGQYLGNPGSKVSYAMRRAMSGYSARAAVITKPGTFPAANAATGQRMIRVGSYSAGTRSRLLTNGGLSGGRLING